MTATRSGDPRASRSAFTPAVEPVITPGDKGWLTCTEARQLLQDTFGRTVCVRTIQGWTRDPKRPLRRARLGRKLLVHRSDLLKRVIG